MSRTRVVVAAWLASMLGACATTGGPPPSSSPEYIQHYYGEYDVSKVSVVNRWAEQHGATVIWIHYPTKHATSE